MLVFSKNIRLRYCDDVCFAVNISDNRIIRLNAEVMHVLETDVEAGKVSMRGAYELGPKVSAYIEKLVRAGVLMEVPNENRRTERLV